MRGRILETDGDRRNTRSDYKPSTVYGERDYQHHLAAIKRSLTFKICFFNLDRI